MGFNIGDKVIHSAFGLGEIVDIEEKIIHGQPTNCYVFCAADLMVWIPINDLQQHSLRMPTLPEEFERLSVVLSNPSESLFEDREMRKNQLVAQMKDGQLVSMCRVVRDLTNLKRSKRLNDQEKSILERAVNSVLTEWTYSLKIPLQQAHQAMTTLLGV